MLFNFPAFGTRPKGSDLEKMQASPQYSRETEKFRNRLPHLFAQMKKRSFSLSSLRGYISGENVGPKVPVRDLPEVHCNILDFLSPSPDLKVIWFGHSSFILNIDGAIVLVDPVFSASASPFSFIIKRFQKPALSLSELPKVDYVLLSHDHYDHLDMEAIKFFKDQPTKFITPLGVGSHLKGWGIDQDRITELDWWQSATVSTIDFIATPAQHFSGRDGLHENVTLWASWVIRKGERRIYFSGDSGYDVHFKEIGEKFGPFDIAFMETGQYNPNWPEVHMMPEEAAQAYFDLKAKRFFPIHWCMFVLSNHTWYDPILRISKEAERRGINLIAPKLGEIVTVNDEFRASNWWLNEIDD